MKTRQFLIIFLILCGLNSCFGDDFAWSFESTELISSGGEKIYINSINRGVTGDHQRSVVTDNKNKLKDNDDTSETINGLEPFIYSFNNDTLELFFNGSQTYVVGHQFKTITITYTVLSNPEYGRLISRTINNDGYFAVPRRRNVEHPDMPKPPEQGK